MSKKKIFSEFFPPPSHMYSYDSRQCVCACTIALVGERALCGARDVYIIHKRARAGISRAVVANAHASSFLSHASFFLSLSRTMGKQKRSKHQRQVRNRRRHAKPPPKPPSSPKPSRAKVTVVYVGDSPLPSKYPQPRPIVLADGPSSPYRIGLSAVGEADVAR